MKWRTRATDMRNTLLAAFALMLLALSAHAEEAKWASCSMALVDGTLLSGWQLAMGGGSDIPAQFWGAELKARAPIAVRVDRGNVAVVTESSNARESGLYYVLRGSQYLPSNSNGRFFSCSTAGGQLEFTFNR